LRPFSFDNLFDGGLGFCSICIGRRRAVVGLVVLVEGFLSKIAGPGFPVVAPVDDTLVFLFEALITLLTN
jgi:hypothetical protein